MNSRLALGLSILLALGLKSACAQMPDPASHTFGLSGAVSGNLATAGPSLAPDELGLAFSDDLVGPATASAISSVRPDALRALRGNVATQLYRRVSPAVVLIVTKDGFGSGSLLNRSGDILTNWHVVRGGQAVGVIFKPKQEGQQLSQAEMLRATVVRVDEVADLALIRVSSLPPDLSPIEFGQSSDLQIGGDVHAIGHPTGEAWTYTKGVISQVRQGYKWTSRETKKAHQATVIQTQTPINPGNSGGPLLGDDGRLLGVNSFKSEGEGLNFAVALDEVKRFLSESGSRLAENVRSRPDQGTDGCKGKELYRGRSRNEKYEVIGVDLDCDGKVDAELRLPYDPTQPMTAVFDRNGDGREDIIVFSFKRDGRWNSSFHDVDYDGKWDLVGYHPDGKMIASRFEPYATFMARR